MLPVTPIGFRTLNLIGAARALSGVGSYVHCDWGSISIYEGCMRALGVFIDRNICICIR